MNTWIAIKGFKNYEINEKGEVRKRGKFKIIKPTTNFSGYLRVCLKKSGKQHTELVHRLVALNYITNHEGLPQVNHKDGNKLNNHYSKLEWCTPLKNMQHASKIGLLSGRKNRKKLTVEQMKIIRGEILHGERAATVAKKYNCTVHTIYKIKCQKKLFPKS